MKAKISMIVNFNLRIGFSEELKVAKRIASALNRKGFNALECSTYEPEGISTPNRSAFRLCLETESKMEKTKEQEVINIIREVIERQKYTVENVEEFKYFEMTTV